MGASFGLAGSVAVASADAPSGSIISSRTSASDPPTTTEHVVVPSDEAGAFPQASVPSTNHRVTSSAGGVPGSLAVPRRMYVDPSTAPASDADGVQAILDE